MKLQVGLLHRDGHSADRPDFHLLLDEFSEIPVDIQGTLLDGPLLIAYRGDRITSEEENETQPFEHGPYVITFDGRLDNRETIASRLNLDDLPNMPDPVITLKAYSQFGENIFPDLLGEFAFTIWSRTDRSLLFVRSFCGARPLYYVLNDHTLIWSSDLEQLVRVSEIKPYVDEQYVLEYLIADPVRTRTPYSNVHTVPPGTILRFKHDAFTSPTRFWEPADAPIIRCASDAEYEEMLRVHLKDAVRARLRSNRTVFAELSGGLDSSSIVLLADDIAAESVTPQDHLQTLSCVYETSETCDERRFISMVEEKRGIPTRYVHEHEQHLTLGLEDIEFTGRPNTMHLNRERYQRFSAIMRHYNARVLLTGIGGDHLFCSSPEGAAVLADLLSEAHFSQVHRECQLWSAIQGIPYFPLFQQAWGLAFRSRMPHGSRTKHRPVPPWIAMREADKTLAEIRKPHMKPGVLPSVSYRCRSIELLIDLLCLGHTEEYRDLYVSHPYTHRPLVEFCIGIPIAQLLRAGQTRSIMRRALANILPPKIIQRKSKGSMDEAVVRIVQREWHMIGDLKEWEVCRRGYVKSPQYLAVMNNLRLGKLGLTLTAIRVCVIEQWLRSLANVGKARSATLADSVA